MRSWLITSMSDSRMPAPAAGSGPAPAAGSFRALAGACLAASALVLSTCQVEVPTAARDELVRTGVAVELSIPFDDFVASTAVYGGYGRASGLGGGFLAHEFGPGLDEAGNETSGLEAATLVRFDRFPSSVSVTDTSGTNRPDTAITFHAGSILARFDTVGSVAEGPVELTAHIVTEDWDPVSATWRFSVDTIGNRVPWSVPGGGALDEEIATGVWDPAEGDSVELMLDSALIAAWTDSVAVRDIRLTATTPGVRLRLVAASLRLETFPTIRPDTLVFAHVAAGANTFVYDPVPRQPVNTLRVGGAPSWRTIVNLDIPHSLTGYPSLCAQLECPVEIRPEHVSFAGLQLTTVQGAAAFALSDSLLLDVRMVTAPNFLPKSPLGPSTLARSGGARVAPELYRPDAGQVFEVPITEHVRDLLRGETLSGDDVSSTLALMTLLEPLTLEYATFAGRQSATPPMLRLILNFSRGG